MKKRHSLSLQGAHSVTVGGTVNDFDAVWLTVELEARRARGPPGHLPLRWVPALLEEVLSLLVHKGQKGQ